MKRIIAVVSLILAGFCLGQAAPPLKFPWAPKELSKTRTMTELEWRCEKASVQRGQASLMNRVQIVHMQIVPRANGLLVQCELTPSPGSSMAHLLGRRKVATEALLDRIHRTVLPIADVAAGKPLSKTKLPNMRVTISIFGYEQIVMGLPYRELGPVIADQRRPDPRP